MNKIKIAAIIFVIAFIVIAYLVAEMHEATRGVKWITPSLGAVALFFIIFFGEGGKNDI